MRNGINDNSIFAVTHPAALAVYYVIAIGITMFSNNPLLLVISMIAGLAHAAMLKGSRRLRPTLILMAAMVVLSTVVNGIFTHRGATVLFRLGHNRVTFEAFVYGFIMGLMIAAVIAWFSGLSAALDSEKIIYLFGRVAPSLGLVISMALRAVPLMRRRYVEISEGQKCLGRKGGLRQTLKKVSILISWSLESSIETADSMSARGYGLKRRTSYHLYKLRGRDLVIILVSALAGGLAIYGAVLHAWDMYYYPVIRPMRSEGPILEKALALVSFTALMLIPVITDTAGHMRRRTYENC